jgi:hypothetical protein
MTGGYLQASVGSVSNQSVINVLAGDLFRVVVTPNPGVIFVGEQETFTAVGEDVYSNKLDLVATEWNSTIGTIISSGDSNAVLKAPDVVGKGSIAATSGGISGLALVEVKQRSSSPIINGKINDILLMEDDPPYYLDLSKYESDPDNTPEELKWYIEGIDTSRFTVTGQGSESNQFVITPAPNAFGNTRTTVILRDPFGLEAKQPMWVNITPVNDKPSISNCPDLVVHYDVPYTFDYGPYTYDLETPSRLLSMTVEESLGTKHHTVNGLNVTYEFPEELDGQTIIGTLRIFDGEDYDVDTISISVTSDYVPELEKDLPDVILYEGETKYNVFNLTEYFNDPDGDKLYFSYGDTHVQVTIHSNNTVDVSSPGEWYGVDTITFRATDPFLAISEDTIRVVVLPINDAPSIKGVPDLVVHYDLDYHFDLSYYITDIDNKTEDLSLTFVDPVSKRTNEYIRIDSHNNLKMVVNYPEVFNGETFSVRIIVTDALDFGYQDIKITVSDDYPPEVTGSLPDVEFYEDESEMNAFDLDDYFSDRDDDIIYYSSGNKFVQVDIGSDGKVDFWAVQDWFGEEYVNFRATDPSGALFESGMWVYVKPVNDAPLLDPIPDQYRPVGIFSIDLSNNLTDVDNDINSLNITAFSQDSQLEVYVNGLDLVIIGTEPVKTTITVFVSDGLESDTGQFTVEVYEYDDGQPETGTDMQTIVIIILMFLLLLVILFVIAFVVVYRGSYTVEMVYLIYHDGRLLKHLQSKEGFTKDADIFSGMFTAIQEFINETFAGIGEGKDAPVKKLQFGDRTILIEKGKTVYLVLVVLGRPGIRLERQMVTSIKDVEKNYPALEDWSGLSSKIKGIEEYMEPLIKEPKEVKEKRKLDLQT